MEMNILNAKNGWLYKQIKSLRGFSQTSRNEKA